MSGHARQPLNSSLTSEQHCFLLLEHWEHLKELLRTQDEAKLRQIFASRLSFGTAGLRGLMGPGPGNMNRLVVREATAGLAIYLLQAQPACREQSVVVAYDGRHDSKLFAADAAGVLAANGVKVRLYDCEAPTPLGAYAVKTLGTAAGIVVTASHNPPVYNGYKVYQAGGCQINTPVDAEIAACIDRVAKELYSPKCLSLQEAEQKGLLTYLDNSMFGRYVNEVINYFPLSPTSAKQRSDLRIAYTALHGVGSPVAEGIFLRAGFNFESVEQQRLPDPTFSTVKFPNVSVVTRLLLCGTEPRLNLTILHPSGLFSLCSPRKKELWTWFIAWLTRSTKRTYVSRMIQMLIDFRFRLEPKMDGSSSLREIRLEQSWVMS